MTHIAFTIPGKPQAWMRRDKHGKTNIKVRRWESLVGSLAMVAAPGVRDLRVPMGMSAVFIFGRPRRPTHPETGTTKTPSGERHCLPAERSPYWPKPDLDNLIKGVKDGITKAGFWRDDCYVTLGTIEKYYAAVDEQPHTEIKIWRLT